MTLLLKTNVPQQINLFRHPFRRIWVNHQASRVAGAISGSTIHTEHLIGDHALQDAAAYLVKRGIHQIEKRGRTWIPQWLSPCTAENAALPNAIGLPEISSVATFQFATHQKFLAGKRSVAAVNSAGDAAEEVPIDRLLQGASETHAYNLLPPSGFTKGYYGPGIIIDTENPGGDRKDNEGELSVLQSLCPSRLPMHTEDTPAGRIGLIPSVALKDETPARSVLPAATGGLIGMVNFGPRRLYQLVFDNARFLFKNISASMQDRYTVFLGKCDRYIRFFGTPMVGDLTLEEFTSSPVSNVIWYLENRRSKIEEEIGKLRKKQAELADPSEKFKVELEITEKLGALAVVKDLKISLYPQKDKPVIDLAAIETLQIETLQIETSQKDLLSASEKELKELEAQAKTLADQGKKEDAPDVVDNMKKQKEAKGTISTCKGTISACKELLTEINQAQFMLLARPIAADANLNEEMLFAFVARGTVAPQQFVGIGDGPRAVWRALQRGALLHRNYITPHGDVIPRNLARTTRGTLRLRGLTPEENFKVFDILQKAREKAGQVKYAYPAKKLAAHLTGIAKSMGIKLAHGIRGKDLAAFLGQIPEASLTAEEQEQLKEMKDAAKQADVECTTWDFMEVLPGAFVSQKAWLERLDQQLSELDKKYKDKTGNSMLRILRQKGNHYRLEDLVFLAMSTSDQGASDAGFVGKFPDLQGTIDPVFMQEVYKIIRDNVFVKGKIYAVNLGAAAEVIGFNDAEAPRRLTKIIDAAVTYDHRIFSSAAAETRAEWNFWRTALGIPKGWWLGRRIVENSFVGPSSNQAFHWWRSISGKIRHWWRRDQVIVNSSVGNNLSAEGKCYLYGTDVDANEPLRTRSPLFGIHSEAALTRGAARQTNGILLYHHGATTPDFPADLTVGKSGFYFTIFTDEPAAGSGESAPHGYTDLEFPNAKAKRVDDPDRVKKTLPVLSPDTTTAAEVSLLNKILGRVTRHREGRN